MNLDRLSGPTLSLFRIVIGFLFLCHGLASLFGVFGGVMGTGESVPVGTWPGWWAALIQLTCGGAVMLGLLTRPAAFLASGSMAYAYFVEHQPDGLLPLTNHGELATLFCWSLFLILVLGPGPWSIDSFVRKVREASTVTASPSNRQSVQL